MQMKISKSIKYKLHLAATTIFWDLMLRGANLLLLMHFHSSKNEYVRSEEGSKLLQRRYLNPIPPQRSATLFFNISFFWYPTPSSTRAPSTSRYTIPQLERWSRRHSTIQQVHQPIAMLTSQKKCHKMPLSLWSLL